tara:strand:- start:138 stop:359 length:222 start_codon:yes stop_codon:yes gene_type:complete
MQIKKKYNKDIIDLVKERLTIGKREYGTQINVHDGRDWNQEALEEILDCCVYVAARVLQLKDLADRKIKEYES